MTVANIAHVLPEIAALRARCQELAILDEIVNDWPGGGLATFLFHPRWAPGEDLACWSNGAGDEYSIIFSAAGAFMRGFDHEAETSPWRFDPPALWPGLVDGLPKAFSRYLVEPTFSPHGVLEMTECLWRETGDDRWYTGTATFPPSPFPSLFQFLVDSPEERHKEFEYNLGRAISLPAVKHVYASKPLTEEVVRGLNPDLSLNSAQRYVARIGYPPAR